MGRECTGLLLHRAVLQRNGVQMLSGVEYVRIDDAGLHITVNGQARVLEVDHVVLCAGQESLTELMPTTDAPVVPGAPRFHKIGGAALASELDAKRALREGATLANETRARSGAGDPLQSDIGRKAARRRIA